MIPIFASILKIFQWPLICVKKIFDCVWECQVFFWDQLAYCYLHNLPFSLSINFTNYNYLTSAPLHLPRPTQHDLLLVYIPKYGIVLFSTQLSIFQPLWPSFYFLAIWRLASQCLRLIMLSVWNHLCPFLYKFQATAQMSHVQRSFSLPLYLNHISCKFLLFNW